MVGGAIRCGIIRKFALNTTLVMYQLWWGCWGGESLSRLNDGVRLFLIGCVL